MRKLLKVTACCLLLFIAISANAQKKNFTYDQLFKNAPLNVTKPLPAIRGWADDEHYLEMQKDASGKEALMSVDVKTGKAVPYTGTVGQESRMVTPPPVNVPGARNITA